MAASYARPFIRRAGAGLTSVMLAAGLALAVAPTASANGFPRCSPADFTGGAVIDTSPSPGLGVMTISGDVSPAGAVRCDGQLVVAPGTSATLHLSGANNLTVYALDAPSSIDNQGTLTITGSGTLELDGNDSNGIDNSGTVKIAGGTVIATGGDGGDSHGGHGISNMGTLVMVGGSLTATGGSGQYGGDGIRNHNGATLVTTIVPTLGLGAATNPGSTLRNWSWIVMPVSDTAPYAGFGSGDAQAAIDANNDAATPRMLYLFDAPPALGLRSPTHALRNTPLPQVPTTTTTVGNLLGILSAISAHWPTASSNLTFSGWFDAATGGATYPTESLIASLATPTFYAQWSLKQEPSQEPQTSPTQTATATATATASTPSTTRTMPPSTTSAPTSAFTPTNNVANPYTFTSATAPSAPALPSTSSASDGSGSQLDLNHVSVPQSGDFTATASGFEPGTVADFYLWSTPVYLGSAIADIHGVAVLHIKLIPAYVGEHHVQVVGTGAGGQARNLAQAITITAPPALAETGLGAAWLLGPAALLLLLGIGLMRLGRRNAAARH